MSQSNGFSALEVKEILRKEEEKRRREAKARETEIFALMNEQNLDFQGKLWGENSIYELAQKANSGNGTKWETDYEAKLISHKHTPERAYLLKEVFVLAKSVVLKFWTETQWCFFLTWLDCESWEELAIETNYTPASCVTLVKAMVAKIRERAGTNPETFPFDERLDQTILRKINHKIFIKRVIEGKSAPADLENRVYLTPEEKEMSLGTLWEGIKSRGHNIAYSTVWRAKAQGFYMKPGWERGGAEKVFLTEEDKNFSSKKLSAKYGISFRVARLARERGFFVVNEQNRDRVVKEGRDISHLL